jgi:hypothetical protein
MKKLNILFFLTLFTFSCKSDYEKKLYSELNTGVKYDSLFYDLKIGQTQQQFFDLCWKMNKEQLIMEGGGRNVKYILPLRAGEDSTKIKEVLFYGIFDDKKIMQGMDMKFVYRSWSPWVRNLQSDSLILDLKEQMESAYKGNKFEVVELDKKVDFKAYVKIDGNRQITLYQSDRKDVKMKIEDTNYIIKKK